MTFMSPLKSRTRAVTSGGGGGPQRTSHATSGSRSAQVVPCVSHPRRRSSSGKNHSLPSEGTERVRSLGGIRLWIDREPEPLEGERAAVHHDAVKVRNAVARMDRIQRVAERIARLVHVRVAVEHEH